MRHLMRGLGSRKDRLSIGMQPLGLIEFRDGRSCGPTNISQTTHADEHERVEPATPARAGDVSTIDFVIGRPEIAVSFARPRVEFAAEILRAAVGAVVG